MRTFDHSSVQETWAADPRESEAIQRGTARHCLRIVM